MAKIDKIRVFTDFDGTIAVKDIGDQLFKDFGEFEPWHSKLLDGDMEISDYWRKVCSTLDENLTPEDLSKYAESCEIDPYFKSFADFCKEQGLPLTVVSDGYDAYIKPILKKLDLDYLPVFSNRLNYEDSAFVPEFPGASESCECFCASCKRNSVLNSSDSDSIIIFIGDGNSDMCVAEHADIVFAKKKLAKYCNKERIPHYPYKTFFDVKKILSDILEKGKFRNRHQAVLKRKKAFEVE